MRAVCRTLVGALFLAAGAHGHAGLVEVIAKAKPSIAAVGTYNALESPRFGFRGTGFAVGDGNLLVTSAHVLADGTATDPRPALVIQPSTAAPGTVDVRAATVLAVDRPHDLALLRFEGRPLPALPIADPKDIREGLSIALIGFPIGGLLGFAPVTHRGIISAITAIARPLPTSRQLDERALRALRDGAFDIYQLDATAYPGNSGGPVLDGETGDVVGVVNMVLAKGTKESALSSPTGITYAIPAQFVTELLKRR